MQRPFVQQGVRGPGVFRSTTHVHPATPSLSATDPCLIVLINKTREGLTLRSESRTPHGGSFLDTMTVDMEADGVATLVCCAGNDLHVDCSNGLHKLSIHNGELRLLPGFGFRQKMISTGLLLPVKYTLHVEIEAVSESKEHVYPALGELLQSHARFVPAAALAELVETLPKNCTLLVPKTIPRILASLCPEDLLKHLTIPVALFFNEKRGGKEKTLDDANVAIEILPNGQVGFAVGPTVNAPETKFTASVKPLRCSERFQLMYICE